MKKNKPLFLFIILIFFSSTQVLSEGIDDIDNRFSEIELLSKTISTLENNSLNTINHRTLTFAAIQGMITALNDPYAKILTRKDFQILENNTEKQIVGVGIVAHRNEQQQLVINYIYPNSPASRLGIKIGSTILSVEDSDQSEKLELKIKFNEIIESLTLRKLS